MAFKSKEDEKSFQKDYYQKNKEKHKASVAVIKKAARERNRLYTKGYLTEHPCIDCGEKDIVVLEFDHVKGKKAGNISQMAMSPVSLEVLQKEIEKCEVRCANCHRRATHQRRIVA